ncbi:hypothetical protein [Paenibacillus thiaminolyticus]|uniref:hypothetical protein n=1 Tax=Paenibacillus thiaminolyticus TaxID=49283 RepID=UPI0025430B0B|nr:hypothetical protein [Paenibacillus thiaminolyticus]WII35293.1 hypothetical protein O0V01_16455 [Paenibacillus thiaminolyticus]
MEMKKLKELIEEWQVEKKTKEHFLLSFNNYMVEQEKEFHSSFGDFAPASLSFYIKKISVELKNFPELDYNHFVSYLWIEYKEKVVGEYRLVFTLDGEIYDDNLIIY